METDIKRKYLLMRGKKKIDIKSCGLKSEIKLDQKLKTLIMMKDV